MSLSPPAAVSPRTAHLRDEFGIDSELEVSALDAGSNGAHEADADKVSLGLDLDLGLDGLSDLGEPPSPVAHLHMRDVAATGKDEKKGASTSAGHTASSNGTGTASAFKSSAIEREDSEPQYRSFFASDAPKESKTTSVTAQTTTSAAVTPPVVSAAAVTPATLTRPATLSGANGLGLIAATMAEAAAKRSFTTLSSSTAPTASSASTANTATVAVAVAPSSPNSRLSLKPVFVPLTQSVTAAPAITLTTAPAVVVSAATATNATSASVTSAVSSPVQPAETSPALDVPRKPRRVPAFPSARYTDSSTNDTKTSVEAVPAVSTSEKIAVSPAVALAATEKPVEITATAVSLPSTLSPAAPATPFISAPIASARIEPIVSKSAVSTATAPEYQEPQASLQASAPATTAPVAIPAPWMTSQLSNIVAATAERRVTPPERRNAPSVEAYFGVPRIESDGEIAPKTTEERIPSPIRSVSPVIPAASPSELTAPSRRASGYNKPSELSNPVLDASDSDPTTIQARLVASASRGTEILAAVLRRCKLGVNGTASTNCAATENVFSLLPASLQELDVSHNALRSLAGKEIA
jgi:hypothetical protein